MGVNPPADIASGRIAEAFLNLIIKYICSEEIKWHRTSI